LNSKFAGGVSLIKSILRAGSWLVAGILLFFTARRWLFMISALLAKQPASRKIDQARPESPSVLLLVPIRNEAPTLPGLLSALDKLEYPNRQLTVVFIDDGSTDQSRSLIGSWIEERWNWHLLSLGQNQGKARALNAGLDRFPHRDIVAVFDADERPHPAALQQLITPFSHAAVGGVSGRRAIGNALASPAASYTAFEGLVHQLVTMRAKDRLKLAPALLGSNCAYRAEALAQVGNFRAGALLEDTDLTLKLARAGWQIRFEPGAISYHHAPETISGYWQQHLRWARGFNEVAKDQARSVICDQRLPLSLRLELLTFSLGYLDRLAVLAGAGLSLFKATRWPLGWILAFNLLTPVFQIVAALKMGREPPAMWGRMIWVPFFFGLDIAMAGAGLWKMLKQSPKIWEERQARH
jgi:cellulose synthase/poly-beta-1,6-N-acetylglucosamine synthase-like glycosyltransferase